MTQSTIKRGRCFVIQPFDGKKFDNRYTDVFAPAIKNAGLEPYRVDQDPSVAVPIETIEQQIAEADVCFAEITLDNPNVWFEVGYARALRKPLCMVCSSERTTPTPFDVQHRAIIQYDPGAPSDFEKLRRNITAKLAALKKAERTLQDIASLPPATQTHGLSPHEMAVLTLLLGDFGERFGSSSWSLKQDMLKAGYTAAATGLAVKRLNRSGMIHSELMRDEQDNGEGYWAWVLTEKANDWLLANEEQFELRCEQKNMMPFRDEDIPF